MQGYNYREAVDGRDGVTAFKEYGPFECVIICQTEGFEVTFCSVVLLDLSMPVLDGKNIYN